MNTYDLNENIFSLITELNENVKLRGNLGLHSDVSRRLREYSLSNQVCTLIFYWGVFHRKENLAAESELIAYLQSITSKIESSLLLTVDMNVIFTDTHAELNLIDKTMSAEYFNLVADILPNNWKKCYLSDVVSEMPKQIEGRELKGFERVQTLLSKQSSKLHNNEITAKKLSIAYLHSNLIEAAAVQKMWPSGIFLHSGVPELSTILPSMPIMYIYSGHNKVNQKPWFRKVKTK